MIKKLDIFQAVGMRRDQVNKDNMMDAAFLAIEEKVNELIDAQNENQ